MLNMFMHACTRMCMTFLFTFPGVCVPAKSGEWVSWPEGYCTHSPLNSPPCKDILTPHSILASLPTIDYQESNRNTQSLESKRVHRNMSAASYMRLVDSSHLLSRLESRGPGRREKVRENERTLFTGIPSNEQC